MNRTTQSGSFLRSDEKSWISSRLFYFCLNKLSINDRIYHMNVGMTCENAELRFYVARLYDELIGVDIVTQEEREAYDYVRKVAYVLNGWASCGYAVKIV